MISLTYRKIEDMKMFEWKALHAIRTIKTLIEKQFVHNLASLAFAAFKSELNRNVKRKLAQLSCSENWKL